MYFPCSFAIDGGAEVNIVRAGRELRTPFLDESFTEWVSTIPLSLRLAAEHPRGEGEKWILRQVASQWGVHAAAALPKSAIQFGSKAARVMNREWFGTDKTRGMASFWEESIG